MNTRNHKLEEYLKQAKEYIPEIKTSSVFSMYNPGIHPEAKSGKIELSGNFLNAKALSKGNIQFAHYTSLRNAMNILNSGSIRLYNCLNLNDPNEIKYLLDKSPMNFSENEINLYKREHFILSGSLIQNEEIEDYNLWRLYGDNCKGVSIVFEINETLKNWTSVYLQEVNYERDNKSWLYDYLKFHKDFNEQYQLFQNKPQLFALLSAGVKNEIWSIEKEFRIVISNPFDEYSLESIQSHESNGVISPTLKHEFNLNGKLVSYVELPLHLNGRKSEKTTLPFTKKEVDLIDYVPHLKIKKIIFGPNCPIKNKEDFFHYELWAKNKIKYDYEVCMSKYKL